MTTIYLSISFLMKPLVKIFVVPILFVANCVLLIPFLVFTLLLLVTTDRSKFTFAYDDESIFHYRVLSRHFSFY